MSTSVLPLVVDEIDSTGARPFEAFQAAGDPLPMRPIPVLLLCCIPAQATAEEVRTEYCLGRCPVGGPATIDMIIRPIDGSKSASCRCGSMLWNGADGRNRGGSKLSGGYCWALKREGLGGSRSRVCRAVWRCRRDSSIAFRGVSALSRVRCVDESARWVRGVGVKARNGPWPNQRDQVDSDPTGTLVSSNEIVRR